jgi:beta-galactosidase
MHGTLVDQSGRPRPFYEEVGQLGQDLATASPILMGSETKASVAMLNDYDNSWSLQWQRHHQDFDYERHFTHYYRPLASLNVPVDILPVKRLKDIEDLRDYKLLIAPALLIQDPTMVETLRNYVGAGGHLLLTLRSGMKDRFNALLPQRQPGGLSDIAGVEVEDYYALQDPVPVSGSLLEGQSSRVYRRSHVTANQMAGSTIKLLLA